MRHRFKGGDLHQRGRGIGGFFRAIGSLFKPLMKSAGKTIVKAATSKTGKAVGEALKEQAINSAVNMTADVLRGNDLQESVSREYITTRNTLADAIETNVGSKRKAPEIERTSKKVKRGNVKSKLSRKKKKSSSWEDLLMMK